MHRTGVGIVGPIDVVLKQKHEPAGAVCWRWNARAAVISAFHTDAVVIGRREVISGVKLEIDPAIKRIERRRQNFRNRHCCLCRRRRNRHLQ